MRVDIATTTIMISVRQSAMIDKVRASVHRCYMARGGVLVTPYFTIDRPFFFS